MAREESGLTTAAGPKVSERGAPQAERDTIKEREALEAEEAAAAEAERLRLEARKLQTKEIVVDTIAKEEAAARAAAEVRACTPLMPLPINHLHASKCYELPPRSSSSGGPSA